MVNFFLTIILGIIIINAYLTYIFYRDQQNEQLWFGRHRNIAWAGIVVFIAVILASLSLFIQPYILTANEVDIEIKNINNIKIALIADMQIGNHKKSAWMEKVINKIIKINPDLVLIGGDLISNEGTFEDQSIYLEPLSKLVGKYQIYAVLGNHEYGIARNTKMEIIGQTGDRTKLVIDRLKLLNIPILRNQLTCPTIKEQSLCIFGSDDIWGSKPEFSELKNWDRNIPIILLSHNPDTILYWPKDEKPPDLVLVGHTHGGQIYLPFIGPLGNAGVRLGRKYYRGLNYWNDIPIFTTVGAGESGGPIRFWVLPEVAEINIYEPINPN